MQTWKHYWLHSIANFLYCFLNVNVVVGMFLWWGRDSFMNTNHCMTTVWFACFFWYKTCVGSQNKLIYSVVCQDNVMIELQKNDCPTNLFATLMSSPGAWNVAILRGELRYDRVWSILSKSVLCLRGFGWRKTGVFWRQSRRVVF